MKEFWNERYQQTAYAYGKLPNVFLAEHLSHLPPGRILFPAEGEGRNAVYAAQLGWEVTCFDQSDAGKEKALALATELSVSIDYHVHTFMEMNYPEESFDAIGLIYAHMPEARRRINHQRMIQCLKPGGIIILEAFSKSHLYYRERNPDVGGPAVEDLLYSSDDIAADFADLSTKLLAESEINLNEGVYHVGTGHVVRYFGRKA